MTTVEIKTMEVLCANNRECDAIEFTCMLSRKTGTKLGTYYGYSDVSFEDAFEKCRALFETEQSKRYWGEK